MRWSMNHAVFWVTPSARPSSWELTEFLAFAMSQTAGSHLSKPMGRILKDGADLDGELLVTALAPPYTAGLDERGLVVGAAGANDRAVVPAHTHDESERSFVVGRSSRMASTRFVGSRALRYLAHLNYEPFRLVCQVCQSHIHAIRRIGRRVRVEPGPRDDTPAGGGPRPRCPGAALLATGTSPVASRPPWPESPSRKGSSGFPTTRPSSRACSGAAAPPAARCSSPAGWSAPSACTRAPRTPSSRRGAASTPGPTATSRCSARRTPTWPATGWPRSTCPRAHGCSRSSRAGATSSPSAWRSRSTSRRCARTRTATTS